MKDVPDLTPAAFEDRTRCIRISATLKLKRFPVRSGTTSLHHRARRRRTDNYVLLPVFAAFELVRRAGRSSGVAAASAIGHWGRDLVIHCLAADVPGMAMNNPQRVALTTTRSVSALHRAFRGHGAASAGLAGGGASVREDSVRDQLAPSCARRS